MPTAVSPPYPFSSFPTAPIPDPPSLDLRKEQASQGHQPNMA